MVPNMLLLKNNGARIDIKSFCYELTSRVFWRSLILKHFSGKFEKIRPKFLRSPQNLPASKPMISYIPQYWSIVGVIQSSSRHGNHQTSAHPSSPQQGGKPGNPPMTFPNTCLVVTYNRKRQ